VSSDARDVLIVQSAILAITMVAALVLVCFTFAS
jgi:hypothetical protein